MTYQEKYLKYKKKYLELKGAGLNELPSDVLDKIILYTKDKENCKDIFKDINRPTFNAIHWGYLETRIPTIKTTGLNLNNPQSVTCELARQDQIDACNSYRNRCKLKHLFNKYRPGQAIPDNFDVDTLNEILLHTVILDNPERDNDIASLISFGATERRIPNDAFFNKNLTNVIIPNFVTSIGEYAFFHNQLTNVIIPDSVTSIGDYAFQDNKLTNVIIPDSVTYIGSLAFSMNNLTNITMPKYITSINYGTFWKNNLKNVIIPDSVTDIYGMAFCINQLINLNIPNSVTSIGKEAFSMNNLTNVTIGNSVTFIGIHAFINNPLTNVTIPRIFESTINQYFDNLERITYT